MSPDQINAERDQAALAIQRRCSCGSRVILRYDPGCTFLVCLKEQKTVAALPDWQPAAIVAQWNSNSPPP